MMRVLAMSLVVGACSIPSLAQCPGEWHPHDGFPGVSGGSVFSSLRHSDGSLIVGGNFRHAGAVAANAIAKWNGDTWSPLGAGVTIPPSGSPGNVLDILELPGGDIVVSGSFSFAGGSPANSIARWDAASWSPLGGGVTGGGVYGLTIAPNGDIIAGGSFTHAGGSPVNLFARWDGAQWHNMGAIPTVGSVCNSLHTLPSGDILAGGTFRIAGVEFTIIRWDGNDWVGVARLPGNSVGILDFLTLSNGDLVVAGNFAAAGTVIARNIARWDGNAWSAFGPGLGLSQDYVHALSVRPDGALVAAGSFMNSGGAPVNMVAAWNGAAWTPLGSGVTRSTSTSSVNTLSSMADDRLFLGGEFTVAGGAPRWSVAAWDGDSYHTLGAGFDDAIRSLAVVPKAGLVAGGVFAHAGPGPARSVARLSSDGWAALGQGFPPPQFNLTANQVNSVCRLPNDDIFATGLFYLPGVSSADSIARWDGATWVPLAASGLAGNGFALAAANDGALLVGGGFSSAGGVLARNIARWSNGVFSAIGSGPVATVRAIAVAPDNSIYVGGFNNSAINRVSMWNGAAWLPLAAGVNNTVNALVLLPTGDLVAGGSFTTAGGQPALHVARWNGNAWSPMGDGLPDDVTAFAFLNGDLIAASSTFNRAAIYRWDGTAWLPLLTGFDREVLALAVEPDGTLAIGGRFRARQGEPAAFFVRWTPPGTFCRADFNCDGAENSQDFFDFLNAFFLASPSADFNADGSINSQDFFDFLTRFFDGC